METAALVVAAALALPFAAAAAWRFWVSVPRSTSRLLQLLDAVWTLVPLAFLVVLIVASV